jgi:cell division protein FtsN
VIPFNDRSSTASFVPVRSKQIEEVELPPAVETPEPVEEAAVEAVKSTSAEIPAEVVRTVQEVRKPHAYFIIVGSYKEVANKDKRIAELQAMGYEAEVAPGRGIHRVSAAGFATRAEAQKALKGIKKNLHKGAWIYRRP